MDEIRSPLSHHFEVLNSEAEADSELISPDEYRPVSANTHILALIKKAIPLSFLFSADIGTNFIKSYLIAQAGTDELAALIIAHNIGYFVIYPFPELVGQNVVFISEYFGKANINLHHQQRLEENESVEDANHQIGLLVRQGWFLSAMVSIPASVILVVSPYFLLSLFNQTDKVNHLVLEYNYPVAISLSAEFINRISEGFMSAVDQERWLFPYRAASMSVEVGLSLVLIPRYSVAGAGYASLGKSLFGLGYLMIFFSRHPAFQQRFNIFCSHLGDTNNFKKTLSQSWPRFVTKMAITCSTVGVTIFMGHLPRGRIVVDGTVGLFYGLLFGLNFGVSEAANRIVAQFYGAHSYREMRRVGNLSLALNAGVFSAGAIAYNSMPLVLASLFLNDEEVQEFAYLLRWHFFLLGVSNFLNVLMDNSGKNLAAVQDTFLASASSLFVTTILILPLSAVVVYLTNFDLYGIDGAIILGTLPGALLTLGYWSKHSQVIGDANNEEIYSSNIIFERKFKSFFFKDHKPLLPNPKLNNIEELSVEHGEDNTKRFY